MCGTGTSDSAVTMRVSSLSIMDKALHKEQIDGILTVLSSVARRIGTGVGRDREWLQSLVLESIGSIDALAFRELELWADTLQQVKSGGRSEASAIELLQSRGVAEAPATLAVQQASKVTPLSTIGICGRSCSGKGAVVEALASANREVLLVQADWYFGRRTPCTYRGYPCLEHTDCLAFDRLIDNLCSLRSGMDTVIRVETPWMNRVDVEILGEDIRSRRIVIVEGFLIFAVKDLVDLFDYRVFIDASDYSVLTRRLRRDGFAQFNYIVDVVVPVSKEHEHTQRDRADLVIDGDRPEQDVVNIVCEYLNKELSLGKAGPRVGLPPEQLPWRVHPGDLLMDNAWHPIHFDDYKEWVRKQRHRLDKGEELKGNTFRYRRAPNSDTYEVRLSTQYQPRICRYTLEPTPAWRIS